MTGRSGISTLKKFFDLMPGQTLRDFANEVKELSDDEFETLKAGIEDGSLTY